jgi:glutaredoxin-related protein
MQWLNNGWERVPVCGFTGGVLGVLAAQGVAESEGSIEGLP